MDWKAFSFCQKSENQILFLSSKIASYNFFTCRAPKTIDAFAATKFTENNAKTLMSVCFVSNQRKLKLQQF